MSSAVHPERLVRRPFKLPVWAVTAIVVISLIIGVTGGIVVGNGLAQDEVAPATTNLEPAPIDVGQTSTHWDKPTKAQFIGRRSGP